MKSMADRAANRVEAGAQADERFGFATYDPDAAERRGYSDYSYWGTYTECQPILQILCIFAFPTKS